MKLDILFGGWLKAPNGAAYVVNSMKDHSIIFKKNGIDAKFWSLDNIFSKEFNFSNNNNITIYYKLKNKLKKNIKSIITRYAKHNLFFAKIQIERGISFSKQVVNFYVNCNDDTGERILVHDLFTCYHLLLNKKNNKPIFLVLHNNGNTFSMLTENYPCLRNTTYLNKLRKIEQFVIDRVDRIIFVAENPMNVFFENHPYVDRDKLAYVYNGIKDSSAKRIIKNSQILEFVCVGSVSSRKGQDIIVDALKKLTSTERSKIHVTIVGDGPSRALLEKDSITNKLPIKFIGYSKEIEKYLSNSDIFLLPSRDEGFPISILEAERMGLPIISTKIAGIPEMINDNENGILIDPNVNDLVNIFKNLDCYDWNSMGNNSRFIFLSRFTIDKMIAKYSQILS